MRYFLLTSILQLCTSVTIYAQVTHYFNDPLIFSKPQHNTASEIGIGLIQLIDEAQSTIDLAVYGIRHQPEIITALQAARKRGVIIRAIVDSDIHGANYYMDLGQFVKTFPNTKTDQDCDIRQLSKPQIKTNPYWSPPKGYDGPPSCVGYTISNSKGLIGVQASKLPIERLGAIMHNKFFVIDRMIVWTGSCNLSDSGTGGYNANTATSVKNGALAEWYLKEFDQMFNQGLFHNEKRAQPMFDQNIDGTRTLAFSSPKSRAITRELIPLVRSAQSEILIAVFFLTHKDLTAELIRAHERGVDIQVILDATGAKNEYTKLQFLRAAGIPVKIENWGGKMHCKAATIDGDIFITGSMNWTSAGEYENDENTLVFFDKGAAAQFKSHFKKWWANIPDRWLEDRPDPESFESGSACTDGVDNDFDKLADAADPGCSNSPPPLPSLCPLTEVRLAEGHQLIKGNINSKGKKYFFTPSNPFYDRTIIDQSRGERWFCSPADAKSFGWKSPPRRN